MAAIGSIRKHSTILLIIVAVALLAFIMGDFSRKGRKDKMSDRFIVVGKEYLSYNQYMSMYNTRKDQVKERAERSLTSEEDFQINEQLYNEVVDSMLFAMQQNNLGITVTNEELRDLVAGPQPHQRAMQFFGNNIQLAQRFLDNMDQWDSVDVANYLWLEALIEKETYVSKYLNLLSKAYYMPKAFTKKVQEEMEWKADLEIVQLPYSSPLVSDDKITVTDNDLKKWYEENKYRFKQEQEFRAVDYVLFNVQPSETDLREIEENVARMYEEFTRTDEPKTFVTRMLDARFDSTYFKAGELPAAIDAALFHAPVGTFVEPHIDGNTWMFAKLLATETRPDSVNISFIIVADQGLRQDVRRNKEESKQILDSVLLALRMGIDFYDIAAKYSDYPVAQMPDSGRMWLVDGVNPIIWGSNVFDTIYPLHVGTIIKREVEGATFFVKLHDKSVAERKIQVAIGKKNIEASQETVENIESAANNFANGTDNYKKFSDAVIKHNLNKRTFDRVEKMTYALPGTSGSGCRDIVKWIYDDKTKKEDVSMVYALENMYVVVVVKDIYPEGYKTLENEQIKEYVEMMVKRDKKAEMLEKMLTKSLTEKGAITKVAEKYETTVDSATVSFGDRNFSRFGPESKLIGKIFAQKDTKTNVYKGEMGVYVVKINKFDIPKMGIENSNTNNDFYAQQNAMMYQNRVFNSGSRILKKLYKIEDHRFKVF